MSKMMRIPYDKVFFTSDTHFYHKNIIKYCNRPFDSVEQMNETLITNWNNTVPLDGVVILMGDFAFAGGDKIKAILKQLNGHKYLFLGNHDHQINFPREYPYFESVEEQGVIRVEGDPEIPTQDIFCNHYPMISWDGAHRGTWQCFGHIHTCKEKNMIKEIQSPNQYDVGVDFNDYTPVSFQKLKEIITKQNLYGVL
jgi:calcineurin-like phosphoesterase family protein